MTAQEKTELDELRRTVADLIRACDQSNGKLDTLAEKVDCLLDGRVANCARHDERITVLEKQADQHATEIKSLWDAKASNRQVGWVWAAVGMGFATFGIGIGWLVAMHGPLGK
jgi:uncharacterized coiled-coil protein SlyX